MKNLFLILCLCWWTGAGVAAAAEKPSSEVRVTGTIWSDYLPSTNGPVESNNARLGDTITLQVENLSALRADAQKTGKPITLFIGGMEVTNLFPQPSRVVTITNTVPATNSVEATNLVVVVTNVLSFHLKRLDQNNSVWRALLRRPFANGPWREKIDDYSVSVGLQKGEPVPSGAVLKLVVYKPGPWVWGWEGFLLAVVLGFFVLAAKTELLRDKGSVPAEGEGRRPYSLARVQMACWFLLAAISYVLIYIITGELDTLNAQVLILMGISSATCFSAVAIDQSNPNRPTGLSENWLRDILSDKDGISFHRFQMVVWTVILGAIFFISVVNDLTMPEFSATMLGLMGLSAGTYVGFKFPSLVAKDAPVEKPRPKNPKAAALGTGQVKFSVEPLPGSKAHQLWIKVEGEADFRKLKEIAAPNPVPNPWSSVETTEPLTAGKKVTYKWCGVTDPGPSPFTDEQTVTPT